tara:strand:- start:508 stop:1389 length:882 start_codon:yes stop_codon:yes gene_type:complete
MTLTADQNDVRSQRPMDVPAFDSWTDPEGGTVAFFYRLTDGYLLRFPDRVDFEIDAETLAVRSFPASEDMVDVAEALLHNAIAPLVGNHSGRLHLHGSAVVIGGRGYAFLGLSRRGKTTLAAAFARAGYPFLTEDVVKLERRVGESGLAEYIVHPARPVLRLYVDSASHVLQSELDWGEDDGKTEIAADHALPHADSPVPLGGIILLGPGENDDMSFARIAAPDALPAILQQAFILDVEDKPRLRGHFQRLGDLAMDTDCYALDFPRVFEALPFVIDLVVGAIGNGGTRDGNG